MGSATSKIASKKALAHFIAGPIALIIAFIGNALISLVMETDPLQPSGYVIAIGGIVLFFLNWLIASLYTVPSAVKEKCDKTTTLSQNIKYGLWPAFTSIIGDPNVVSVITFATPLILIAGLIIAVLPVGPLTLGITMAVHRILINIPVIGTIVSLFPLTSLFELVTGSWIFIIFMFVIGYNMWSWVGGAIAATQAMNTVCG